MSSFRLLYGICAVLAALAAGMLPLAGCGPAVPPRHADAGPGVIDAVGQWRDVEEAVRQVIAEAEAAVVRRRTCPPTPTTPGEKRFELRTVHGQPGWLVARWQGDPEIPEDVPGPIRLEAYFKPFGDPPRERRLLRATKAYLEREAWR